MFDRVSPEIAAAQAAYAARPYSATIRTSHFSGSFRFETLAAAIDYVFAQFKVQTRIIASGEMGRSWTSFDCFRSYVETPEGAKILARDILFVTDLSSDRGLRS